MPSAPGGEEGPYVLVGLELELDLLPISLSMMYLDVPLSPGMRILPPPPSISHKLEEYRG